MDEFAINVEAVNQVDSEYTTIYYKLDKEISSDIPETEYVIYNTGKKVIPNGCEILTNVVHPYFERSWLKFCSHMETPPGKETEYKSIIKSENVIYISFPIFNMFKVYGNHVY